MQLVSDSGVQRDAKGRLIKGGGSLNKSGLDRKKLMMLRNLEGLTGKAIARLEQLLEDKNGSVALGAAKEILDRNLGKVKQSVTVDVTSTHVLHLQALETIAARKREQLQAIDITEHATLDRIGSHGQGLVIEHEPNENATGENMSVAAEPPGPPNPRGAAAYAPTPPATHENPTTDPDKKP